MVKIYRRYNPQQQIFRETAPAAKRAPLQNMQNTEKMLNVENSQDKKRGGQSMATSHQNTGSTANSQRNSAGSTRKTNSGMTQQKKQQQNSAPNKNHTQNGGHKDQSCQESVRPHGKKLTRGSVRHRRKLCSVPPPESAQYMHCTHGSGKRKAVSLNFSDLIYNLIPTTVYNPKTKKILGVLTSEDLLLIALIFLFMDNDENSDPMVIIALIYILLSDYIDFPDLLM